MDTKEILSGGHGYTLWVEAAPKIADHKFRDLLPGDMAVLTERNEVMIYCGSTQWVFASKTDGKVIQISHLLEKNLWEFNTPVTLVRWWLLSDLETGDEWKAERGEQLESRNRRSERITPKPSPPSGRG